MSLSQPRTDPEMNKSELWVGFLGWVLILALLVCLKVAFAYDTEAPEHTLEDYLRETGQKLVPRD